jgi:hypothetical protein
LEKGDSNYLRLGFSPKQWSEEEVYKLKKSIKNRRRVDFLYKKIKKEYNKSGGYK